MENELDIYRHQGQVDQFVPLAVRHQRLRERPAAAEFSRCWARVSRRVGLASIASQCQCIACPEVSVINPGTCGQRVLRESVGGDESGAGFTRVDQCGGRKAAGVR
jgi:hypothetical protein